MSLKWLNYCYLRDYNRSSKRTYHHYRKVFLDLSNCRPQATAWTHRNDFGSQIWNKESVSAWGIKVKREFGKSPFVFVSVRDSGECQHLYFFIMQCTTLMSLFFTPGWVLTMARPGHTSNSSQIRSYIVTLCSQWPPHGAPEPRRVWSESRSKNRNRLCYDTSW